jgi:hypothetical protein
MRPESSRSEPSSSGHLAPVTALRGNGSKAIQPGYRKGQVPANKGRKLDNVPLTPDEVRALVNAMPSDRYPTGARNRAMAWLMYRYGLKSKQVVELQFGHYTRGSQTLLVPPAHKAGKPQQQPIDAHTRALLDRWLELRKEVTSRTLAAPFFCTHQEGQRGEPINTAYLNSMLRRAARKAGIEKRVSPLVLRATFLDEREKAHAPQVDTAAAKYHLPDDQFRTRFTKAWQRWEAASTLEQRDPLTHASSIALYCREALEAFADDLRALHDLPEPPASLEKSEAIRFMLRAAQALQPRERALLESLISYWQSIAALVEYRLQSACRATPYGWCFTRWS